MAHRKVGPSVTVHVAGGNVVRICRHGNWRTSCRRELAAAVARGTGRGIEAIPQGSVDDLAALIAEKQTASTNPWEWLPLQYVHNMVSGRAKLDPLDNGRYPEVQPETVEAFAGRTGAGGARGMSHRHP